MSVLSCSILINVNDNDVKLLFLHRFTDKGPDTQTVKYLFLWHAGSKG